MKTKKAYIVNFCELSDEWQEEALSNLDKENAEETLFFEPEEGHNPKEHILRDISEAYPNKGTYKGFKYNATMGISNNSGMLLNFSDDMEEVEYIII